MKYSWDDLWWLTKWQSKRINELERENQELREAQSRYTTLMINGVLEHERMMLKLIVNGNLKTGDQTTESSS